VQVLASKLEPMSTTELQFSLTRSHYETSTFTNREKSIAENSHLFPYLNDKYRAKSTGDMDRTRIKDPKPIATRKLGLSMIQKTKSRMQLELLMKDFQKLSIQAKYDDKTKPLITKTNIVRKPLRSSIFQASSQHNSSMFPERRGTSLEHEGCKICNEVVKEKLTDHAIQRVYLMAHGKTMPKDMISKVNKSFDQVFGASNSSSTLPQTKNGSVVNKYYNSRPMNVEQEIEKLCMPKDDQPLYDPRLTNTESSLLPTNPDFDSVIKKETNNLKVGGKVAHVEVTLAPTIKPVDLPQELSGLQKLRTINPTDLLTRIDGTDVLSNDTEAHPTSKQNQNNKSNYYFQPHHPKTAASLAELDQADISMPANLKRSQPANKSSLGIPQPRSRQASQSQTSAEQQRPRQQSLNQAAHRTVPSNSQTANTTNRSTHNAYSKSQFDQEASNVTQGSSKLANMAEVRQLTKEVLTRAMSKDTFRATSRMLERVLLPKKETSGYYLCELEDCYENRFNIVSLENVNRHLRHFVEVIRQLKSGRIEYNEVQEEQLTKLKKTFNSRYSQMVKSAETEVNPPRPRKVPYTEQVREYLRKKAGEEEEPEQNPTSSSRGLGGDKEGSSNQTLTKSPRNECCMMTGPKQVKFEERCEEENRRKNGKDPEEITNWLLVDLDETLIHSTLLPISASNYSFLLTFHDGSKKKYLVKLRPFIMEFLERISGLYHLIVYTASHRAYAEKVVEMIDPKSKFFKAVLSSEFCLKIDPGTTNEVSFTSPTEVHQGYQDRRRHNRSE
jgi:NLI interacting factor-like phosphatase